MHNGHPRRKGQHRRLPRTTQNASSQLGDWTNPAKGSSSLTNDGDIVNKILRARNNHEKEYYVTVNKPINQDFIRKMSNGVPILDTVTRNCEVEKIGKFEFRIVLTQGLNRQIRRMCEHLGFRVRKLKRVRIMNIELDMPVGEWRYFTEEELNELNRLTSNSDKTFEGNLNDEGYD